VLPFFRISSKKRQKDRISSPMQEHETSSNAHTLILLMLQTLLDCSRHLDPNGVAFAPTHLAQRVRWRIHALEYSYIGILKEAITQNDTKNGHALFFGGFEQRRQFVSGNKT